ncbi:pyridoxal phosphate-dependent aminotransferase [Microbacterium sp. BWT-G7]|uniref:Aminotransferase n=2 Tax=Microbacterium allomyrinae TaxID=2830666 RepID=A0A9X1S441_9MICO|nr:pyridoxal phosphate-dependent aminotransferase [Microbacterium allomyrinae]
MINELVQDKLAAGESVVHLGFGEAGLPPLDDLRETLGRASRDTTYGKVVGSAAARAAVAGWYARRGLPTHPDQVVLAPGSKALLYAVLSIVDGAVVLPQPSWVSYAAQAALLGREVIHVPIPAEAGGVPDPAQLRVALERARAEGTRVGVLVLTLPDNPTGTLAGPDRIREVCEIATEFGVTVLSDEIYRDLAYDDRTFTSPAALHADTIVTGGLSKSLALGGWRIGFARLPEEAVHPHLRDDLIGVASEIWSSLAAPMQAVVEHAMSEPTEVVERIADSRALHRAVALAVAERFRAAGAEVREPTAAFYLYPDFEPVRARLEAHGIRSGLDLATQLLDRGVAVLAGVAFGDEPDALRVRVAVSLLHGADERQRLAALASDDPTSLPWIAAALEQVSAALEEVTT